jgi:hypothetical protein
LVKTAVSGGFPRACFLHPSFVLKNQALEGPMKKTIFVLLVSSMPFAAQATTYATPNGLTEECRVLPQVPGGNYDKDDGEEEGLLCSLDIYDTAKIAICPKTWSTSPGTMIYDISESGLTQAEYEAQEKCGGSKKGHEKITKFKPTMNQKGTSGTFSPASMLYYHFSRYFDTTVKVPVSVYRTIDAKEHFSRVTEKAHTKAMGKGDKNRAGWKWLYEAEQDPNRYQPKDELFTDGDRQIFGQLGDGGGERYGAEIQGIQSVWGKKQNEEFQETPAFLALRSEKPFKEAIAEGLEKGLKDGKIRRAMGPGASEFQMGIWMKELSEIVILDYIFNQQDRIGNIDFKWYYYWIDAEGKVKSEKLDEDTARASMAQVKYPKDVEGHPTTLVQRTRINDNDAGGKVEYTNFTKTTKMLEGLRHINQATYDKLVALDADFQAQGELYQYLSANFTLKPDQIAQIVSNTHEAVGILKATVDAGKMQFDLQNVKDLFKSL